MRISRYIAPAVLALTIVACAKDKDPVGPTDEQLAEIAGANLQTMSTKISDPQLSRAAKTAGFALLNGAPYTEVSLTTTAVAALRGNTGINARVSADIGNATETWGATALQVVVTNSTNTAANGTYNIIALWKSDTDLIFVGAPAGSSSSTIGTTAGGAFGGLFTAPSASWQATGGTAAITAGEAGAACTGFASITGTTCKEATLNGSFSITTSAPYSTSGNTATGSRTAVLGARSFNGVQVTVNCSIYTC